MEKLKLSTISQDEVKELQTAHNVVLKDGSVKVNRTYADVVKQFNNYSIVEKIESSQYDINKFLLSNPNAKIGSDSLAEQNPLDIDEKEFIMPHVHSLFNN